MLYSTSYDGMGGIRAHIDKLIGCYHMLNAMNMDLGQKYMIWFVMGTLPSQFDSIRSSYDAQKEQVFVEEMTVILAKEEDNMKKKGKKHLYAHKLNQSSEEKVNS